MKAAVDMEMQHQRQEIKNLYEMRLNRVMRERWPESPGKQEGGKFSQATVLYADIQHYDRWNADLSSDELSEVINFFYSSVGDTLQLFGVRHMQFVGEGMLCVFVDEAENVPDHHALRAVRAALGLDHATRSVDAFVRQKFPKRHLPPFALTVALDSGTVAFTRLSGLYAGVVHNTPVGATVTAALRLYQCTPGLNWPIACSAHTASFLAKTVQLGKRAFVEVPGHAMSFEAVEVVSLMT